MKGILLILILTLSGCASYFDYPSYYLNSSGYKAIAVNPFAYLSNSGHAENKRLRAGKSGYMIYSDNPDSRYHSVSSQNCTSAYSSQSCANKAAINRCILKENYCVLAWVGNNYVAEGNVANFVRNNSSLVARWRENQRRRNSGITLNDALIAIGRDMENNPVFNRSNKVKVCDFKNFYGEIIRGDCSESSIRKDGEIYWKVDS